MTAGLRVLVRESMHCAYYAHSMRTCQWVCIMNTHHIPVNIVGWGNLILNILTAHFLAKHLQRSCIHVTIHDTSSSRKSADGWHVCYHSMIAIASWPLLVGAEERKRQDYTNKVTPVCVNWIRCLHLVQAPGKHPPSNWEEGHKWGSGGFWKEPCVLSWKMGLYLSCLTEPFMIP